MRGVAIFVGGVALAILLALWILSDSPPAPAPAPLAPESPAAEAPGIPKFTPPPAAPDPAPAPAAEGATASAEAPDAGRPDVGFPVVRVERARPIIQAFDPKLYAVLRGQKNRMAYLSLARPVRDCIRTFMSRRRYSEWNFGGVARLRAQVADGVVSFPSVEISHPGLAGMPERPPDDQFLDCYQRAVQTLRVKCPGCREGELEFSWKLRIVEWTPGSDGLGGWSDPHSDPQLSVAPSGR
jgi:hypothetical protein